MIGRFSRLLFFFGLVFVVVGIFISSNSTKSQVRSLPLVTISPPAVSIPSKASIPPVVNGKLAKVTRVIDGDTIQALVNNKLETIRLIGIDAPESVDPKKLIQCFGKEASEKAKSLLDNQAVSLESDPTQSDRDKYNRLLRYVFLQDGINFDMLMIRQGFAREYTYKYPYKYQQEFKSAQQIAKTEILGLWKVCKNSL